MHVIESLGPLFGLAAFLGLAILAFLLFQQSREVRRLREWAGRAPERAQEAAEAVQAAAEATRQGDGGESGPEPEAGEPSIAERLRAAVGRAWARVREGFGAVDRRLPVDGRYLLALGVIALIAIGVLTGGFGLAGGGGGDQQRHHGHPKPKVAVLNGTAVTGLADLVDKKVIKPAGYKAGVVTNTASSFANTVVMYEAGGRADAKQLTQAIKSKLGETPVQQITPDVKGRAGGAPLALALGLDDAGFGTG